MKYGIKFFAVSLLGLCMLSCGKQSGEQSEQEASDSLIEITEEQFKTSNMEVGGTTLQTFKDEASCKGVLRAPSDGQGKVATPIAGTIQGIRVKVGDYVKRGQVICTISGNEFLSLQQSFAESAAMFQKAKSDYERMKMLQTENIGAKKDHISSETTYRASLASYNALRARIAALHISPSQIEGGQMYSSFPVVAPISGYVTSSDMSVGQYVDVMDVMANVVDVNKLQLHLSVFETDINKLQVGQTVRFAGAGGDEMRATLITVGKAINPDSKSVDCIARLEGVELGQLVNDSYVEAVVEVAEKEAAALPITAVQKSGEEYSIFIVAKKEGGSYFLRKTIIEVGKQNGTFIEVLGGLPENAQDILLRGVDTL